MIVRYVVRCDCGSVVHVRARQAGLVVQCPSCQQDISIPSVSSLRKLPALECHEPRQRVANQPFQYRLRDLLVLTFCWAVILAWGSYVGFSVLLWAFVSFLMAAALAVSVRSSIRFFRKAMCTFWDVVQRHRQSD